MATTLCEQSRFRIIFNAVALYIWRAATQPFIDGVLSQRQRECILKPRAHALAVLSRPFFRAAVLYSSAPVTTWSTSFFGLFHMDSRYLSSRCRLHPPLRADFICILIGPAHCPLGTQISSRCRCACTFLRMCHVLPPSNVAAPLFLAK